MKVATPEEIKEYNHTCLVGGLKGAGIGALLGIGLAFTLKKRQPHLFGNMSATVKVGTGIVPGLAGFSIGAEKAGEAYDDKKYSGSYLDKEHRKEQQAGFMHYLQEHKYKCVFGGWVVSMAGSMWYVFRDKYMTSTQKVVQARMYAQASTIILLFATLAFSASDNIGGGNNSRDFLGKDGKVHHHHVQLEHSNDWKELLKEEEGRLKDLKTDAKQHAQELKEKAKSTADDIKEKTKGKFDEAADEAEEYKEDVKKAVKN
ncbi:Respiratory supercomplex factor 2-like protein [Yarrowia sp. C11]|nr:Respiratory supercomplex factor 2-like protein [Yarrowia sp. C11]KAG5364064.1 Respiratory supercomplex factor 2-like protein [Yarrowia sp. E02]